MAAPVRSETVRLQPFRIDDVMREANQNIAAAKERAEAIVQEAQVQAVAIREAARREGREAGMQEGLRQGREQGRKEATEAAMREFASQHQSLITTVTGLIGSIERDRVHWNAAGRQDLIELAMAIARRVVEHVGECDREVVLANLEEAVRLVGARSDVTIAVSPKDAEAARLFARSLTEMQEQWQHVRIVEEPEVSPGGCRVQWGTGAVDATLETQLERIAAELRGQGSSLDSGDSTGA